MLLVVVVVVVVAVATVTGAILVVTVEFTTVSETLVLYSGPAPHLLEGVTSGSVIKKNG